MLTREDMQRFMKPGKKMSEKDIKNKAKLKKTKKTSKKRKGE